jgi:LPXTG-motif cell wall-anchored protein
MIMKKFTILAVTIIMIMGVVGLNIFASGGVVATPSNHQIELSWNAPSGISNVTYNINGTNGFTKTDLTSTSYTIDNLTNGTLYTYVVTYNGTENDEPVEGTIGTASAKPIYIEPVTSEPVTTTAPVVTTAPVTTASPVITATPTETPVTTTTPVTTSTVTATNTATSTATETPVVTNTTKPTNTCNGITKYTKNDSSYNVVTINAENSKNTNISVTIGGKDITTNQQIVKGGSATFEQKLSNGKSFKKSFKVTEGKNVIYGKNGQSYTFWAYGEDQSIKDADTKNIVYLGSTGSNSGSSVDLGDVTTSKLPSNELITTLPKTGESSNTMLIFTLAGSILVFGGIAFMVKKKLKNN